MTHGAPRSAWRARLCQRIARQQRCWSDAELRAPAVVLAPHQDDETLGCGATIAAKRAAGARVEIVFLADGSSSHARFMDRQALAALRRREALAAAAELGVDRADVHFLDFPDRGLHEHRRAVAAAVRPLLLHGAFDQVYVPLRRDWPGDHSAARLVLSGATAGLGRRHAVFEYPVWFWLRWPWIPKTQPGLRPALARARDLALWSWALRFRLRAYAASPKAHRAKWAALKQYQTQMARRDGDPRWRTLGDMGDGEFLRCFERPFELFWRRPR
ncbi:MAG: PIG-L family deacetylase [Planctomycetota bacterium]